MNIGHISSRYAKALLDYATDRQEQDEVYDAMKLLSEMLFQLPALQHTLQSENVKQDQKKSLLISACGQKIPLSLDRMLDLILKNKRENILLLISLNYTDRYRKRFHIMHAQVTTAVELDSIGEEAFYRKLSQFTTHKIDLDTRVDPDLIGGFVLQLEDYRWDASVSGMLKQMKKRLLDKDTLKNKSSNEDSEALSNNHSDEDF